MSSQSVMEEEARMQPPDPTMIPRPINLEFRDMWQDKNYWKIHKLGVVATKYACPDTMRQIGIYDEVLTLCGRIGMASFVLKRWPTYDKIANEFLSAFEIHNIDNITTQQEDSMEEEPHVSFRLYNREFSLTLKEFNAIYGFPEMDHCPMHADFSAPAFWKAITGEDRLQLARTKASRIQNPVLRYVHRILSSTICGRGDSDGAVNVTELFLMWSMLEGRQVNIGAFLAYTFEKFTKKSKGSMVVGGLITPIAEHFRLHLELLTWREPSLIDRNKIIHMKLITIVRGVPYFIFRDRNEKIVCSNLARITVFDRANWLYFPPLISVADEEPEEPTPPTQPTEHGPSYTQQPQHVPEEPTPETHTADEGPYCAEQPEPLRYAAFTPRTSNPSSDFFDFVSLQSTLEAMRADQTDYHQAIMSRLDQMERAAKEDRRRLDRLEKMMQRHHDYHYSLGHYGFGQSRR